MRRATTALGHASVAMLFALGAVFVSASTAVSADYPIAGDKLRLKRSASGKSTLVFAVKDPNIPFPTPPHEVVSAFDTGLTVFAISGPSGAIEPLRLRHPQSASQPKFERSGSTGRYKHRFRHKSAPDDDSRFKLVLWREGRGLKIVIKDAVLRLDEATGGVGIRWRWESGIGEPERLCAVFTGASIKKDTPGSFAGSDAPTPALADCEDESIIGVVAPAICGDGVISGTEECDGPASCDLSEHPFYVDAFSDCGTVAAGNECRCCTNSGGYFNFPLPCCTPSIAVGVPAPPIGGTYQCISISCAPPFECDEGDTCLPDFSCCGGENALCGGQFSGGAARACCGSLTCAPDPYYGGFLFTCQPPMPCTVNADCVTDFCDMGLCADQ